MKKLNSENWPNLIIVGAARAGTTSLYNFLKETDGIYMSPVKETGHFIPKDPRGFVDDEKYLELFNDVKDEKIIGEATPGYLTTPETPKLIKEKIPNVKIIISIRDPVERTYSMYLNRVRQGSYSIPFDETVNNYFKKVDNKDVKDLERIIYGSSYYNHIKRYLETFEPNQVKVVIFEEFSKEPKKTLIEIYDFLGIDVKPPGIKEQHNIYAEPIGSIGSSIVKNKFINKTSKALFPKSNRESILRTILNKKHKKPTIPKKTRDKLSKVFVDDVRNLKILLKRDLPWKEPFNN